MGKFHIMAFWIDSNGHVSWIDPSCVIFNVEDKYKNDRSSAFWSLLEIFSGNSKEISISYTTFYRGLLKCFPSTFVRLFECQKWDRFQF